MSSPWGSLPLLPLRCILDHLSTEDALAATSVCQHWRVAILLYEGHRETLKLYAKHLDKCMFLSRIFRKHTTKLHIYLNCTDEQMDKFITCVLPQFFDTSNLKQILFIGPSYVNQNHNTKAVKLKRIITESFLFKHIHSLQSVGLLGCQMDGINNDNERFINKHIELHSRPLTFSETPTSADSVLSRSNITRAIYSSIQHIIIDYNQISTEAMETLAHLKRFTRLSVCVGANSDTHAHIDWGRLRDAYPTGLDVSVNIIALPQRKLKDVIENILVRDLPLTALRVMFCKTIYFPLISHTVCLYKESVRELVWSDCPSEASGSNHRVVLHTEYTHNIDHANINPFMLVCWQCHQLRRLVIHGYWIWQYDVIGYVRLRKSLEHLEISAIYTRQGRFGTVQPHCDYRVLHNDNVRTVHAAACIQTVNKLTDFAWSCPAWDDLHPALRHCATPAHRNDYVLREITRDSV